MSEEVTEKVDPEQEKNELRQRILAMFKTRPDLAVQLCSEFLIMVTEKSAKDESHIWCELGWIKVDTSDQAKKQALQHVAPPSTRAH